MAQRLIVIKAATLKKETIMFGILSALRRRMQRSRDQDYLASMSDAMLKDIGIGRSEIFYLTNSGRDDHGLKR